MQKKELYVVPVPVLDTYALTVCALLTALSVVLARLLTIIPSEVSRFSLEAVPILLAGVSVVLARFIIPMPNETTRFSLEAVPIFLAGMLFGPLPGAAVGFAADFIGCLFSPFGYNPIFCLPPILYGLWAGLVRRYVWRRPTLWRAALAVFPAAVCGSVLWQSMALALVYGGAAKWPYFLTRLAARSVQFAITGCIDALLVWLLMRRNALSPVLRRIKTKGGDGHDAG